MSHFQQQTPPPPPQQQQQQQPGSGFQARPGMPPNMMARPPTPGTQSRPPLQQQLHPRQTPSPRPSLSPQPGMQQPPRPGMPPMAGPSQSGLVPPRPPGAGGPQMLNRQASAANLQQRPSGPSLQRHASAANLQQQRPAAPNGGGMGAAHDGRLSPRPPLPSQQQAPSPSQTGAQHDGPHVVDPHALMAQLGIQDPTQQPRQSPQLPAADAAAGSAGQPRSSKRSARAYHQQDAPQAMPQGPASTGWNDVPQQPGYNQQPNRVPQGQQPAWQQAAAARVAQFNQMQEDPNAALDQVPGQRNVISHEQAAFNQSQMQQMQGGHDQNFAATGMPADVGAGINQPPHATGQRYPGPRTKIDPDQIPSPIEAMENDQAYFDKEWFETCGRGGLPLSTTEFVSMDQGNCSPKHMRLTTYSMPATEELASTSQLPLAIVIQPFAQQRAEEPVIPVVDCGPSGPPRCKRCRAYINPWAVFVEGGQKWVCNLCGSPTQVAAEYFCNLDMSGRRADFDQRYELSRGTIEFRVPKEYWAVQSQPPASLMLPTLPAYAAAESAKLTPKIDENDEKFDGSTMGLGGQGGVAAKAATKAASDALGSLALGQGRTTVRRPRPLTYFFAIDVSFSAVRCGSLRACVESIREALYGPRENNGTTADGETNGKTEEDGTNYGYGLPHGSKIAIVTFDKALHFYNLLPHLDHAQMLVVPDIDEPFVPLSEGLLADPWESRTVVESLLDNLPIIFSENMIAEAAFGAVVRAAQASLSMIGGQANIFLSTIPTVGPGSLKHREDTKLYGTEKEKQLFAPQDGFYRGVAEECVEAGIGFNVFFFPSQYIDVATIGTLSGLTGGELFFHPRFDIVRDRVRLDAQIKRLILRETGYNATMRVRCSNGLHVTDHLGNLFMRNGTDVELANIDADKALVVAFRHDGKLDEKVEAHFQTATLYTTAEGDRRVRCHNIAIPVTNLLGNVFRYADLDSTMTYLTKSAIALAQQKPLREVRHTLTERCVKILLAYRRNCASSTSPGQLILPESFKLLPVYVLGLNKSKALKGGNVTSDVRTFFMRFLRGLSCGATMSMLYPRMIALHNMRPDDGEPVGTTTDEAGGEQHPVLPGRIKCPALMRPSYLRMEGHGAYLVDNGEMCLLWIGANVNPRLLEDLYGVTSLDDVDSRMTTLPRLPTKLSLQVRNIVADFARQRCKPTLPVLIARQNRDGTEVELANNLVEDQNNDAMSYVDYLCHVHRIITTEMTGAAKANNSANDGNDHSSLWRGW